MGQCTLLTFNLNFIKFFQKNFILTNEKNGINADSIEFSNLTSLPRKKSLILFTINELYELHEYKIRIDVNNKFKLEKSKHAFSSIILLIEYYITNRYVENRI
jgi:hypothetical protein